MIKQIQTSNAETHPNSKEIRVLKEYFPSCFSKDGSFDFLHFKSLLKDKVDIQNEGYELNFLGKSYAKLLVSLDTETIIVPDIEHNSKQENVKSENIYISGDNLDGLKHLLKSYSGQVKCIYIDPPYNTGKDDFAYNDNFRFTAEELVSRLSIGEDEATRVLEMTQIGSSSHSAWLMFMYPRLVLARDLLTKDGVIFISIDDNEQANLKLLCDTVFGEENSVGTLIWKNATDNNPTNIACEHEYVLAYSLNKDLLESEWKSPLSDIKDLLVNIGNELIKKYGDCDQLYKEWESWYRKHKIQLSPLDRYKYIDMGGVYTGSQSVHNPGKEGYRYDIIHPVTRKACKQPLMGYRFPETTMNDLIKEGKILFGDDENKLVELKLYASEYEDKFSSLFSSDSRSAAYDLKRLFPDSKQLFKNPKPVDFIEHILSFICRDNQIFVDFFSGSSTAAQAIMDMNAKYNEHCKYVMIQLPELCKEHSEAQKTGYLTIDEIGLERIKRAAKAIQKQYPDTSTDLGFKHYTLRDISDTALNRITEFNPDEKLIFQNIYEEFGIETILSTWMVNDGYGFTAQPLELDLDGYNAWYYKKHLYLIEPGLTEESTCRLFEKYSEEGHFTPENIVMFGYSFSMTEFNMIKLNMKSLRDGNLKTNLDIRY